MSAKFPRGGGAGPFLARSLVGIVIRKLSLFLDGYIPKLHTDLAYIMVFMIYKFHKNLLFFNCTKNLNI